MTKKIKNQSTQNVVKYVEASNVSPPYKIASSSSNTNDTKGKKKRDQVIEPHICKCNDNTKLPKPKTWESITKMYGNTETTVVWDDFGKTRDEFLNSKTRKKEKHKSKNLSEQDYCDKNDAFEHTKLKHSKKHKKSVISFYRKKNKHNIHLKKHKLNKDNLENYSNNVKNMKKESPIIRFEVNRRPAHHHDGTGDSCVGGPCTRGLQDLSNRQKKNYTGYATDKRENSRINRNDQFFEKDSEKEYIFLKSTGKKVKNFLSRCSFIRIFSKQSCLNRPQITEDKSKGEPMFEMKVDSVDMRVLNTSEIKGKLKTLGKIYQNRSCICPSRIKSFGKVKHNVCAKGICENALGNNNQTHFNCKCKGKNNLIVCKDTTCGLKAKKNKKRKKCKLCKSSKHENDYNMAAFEVILDRTNMNILNTQEVGKVLKKASNNEICPTGICNVASKDPNIQLRCSCIGKKIIPMRTECTDETCVRTIKKCKLSDICSRLFSNSEYSVDLNRKNIHDHKKLSIPNQKHKQKTRRQNLKTRSDTYNEKMRIPDKVAHQTKRHGDREDEYHETFCECSVKGTSKKDEKEKKKGNNKRRRKDKITRMKCKSSKIKLKRNRQSTLKTHITKCLQRKRVRCKKQLKEKEKEFKKNEKKARKENLRIRKMIEKKNKIEEPHWNCLTKLVSGTLNLGINLIKGIFSMVFSLITNPIGSYVYVRERARDPSGTLKKISDWFYRTWSNKTTKLSQTVKESNTMNVIADQIEDSALYDSLFANKGRTKDEKLLYKKKKRMRKRRIRKRHDEALYGCRHTLLTTLRKTPHLWFYHICPDLYPQCLSLVTFMTNFFHILIYLLAFICWTPCIVSFELCRAFLCCFLCTG
ncbi:unnamed protein product [Euphydryas editha]|uniref:Uncharacterized protein n=1 Tax=Euphydryas editha TaxID=104508 RepID=A0AAU9V6S6_EUPED|nr:unnamed protein product [Euphydryas editha]